MKKKIDEQFTKIKDLRKEVEQLKGGSDSGNDANAGEKKEELENSAKINLKHNQETHENGDSSKKILVKKGNDIEGLSKIEESEEATRRRMGR